MKQKSKQTLPILSKNIDEYKLKHQELDLEYELENRKSNVNRARSINVGTSFGGTSEILMRGDGGRHLWCVLQPVEVIELIHQLSANVGCNAEIKPRKDFSSWRDWRVSELEKEHLNGHPPFVNDMALLQKLGASGFDEKAVNEIMDAIANSKVVANLDDDAEIKGKDGDGGGAPGLMIGVEDNLIHNKLMLNDNNEVLYMTGGEGGGTVNRKNKKQINKNNEK